VDEREAREREILAEHLEGTPVEADGGQMDRLFDLDLMDRLRVVTVIAGGEADSVDAALDDLRWRGEFMRDVQRDIDGLDSL
jgi:hypothetical protein